MVEVRPTLVIYLTDLPGLLFDHCRYTWALVYTNEEDLQYLYTILSIYDLNLVAVH
jgi:hypothetical protein